MDLDFLPRLALACAAWIACDARADANAQLERSRVRVVTQGPVCADPARPCTHSGGPFKPNELSFRAPIKFDFDRGEDRSQPFYAVILRKGPQCGIEERERREAQEMFPKRKVFVHRFFCEDFGDKVTYTNSDRKRGFMAAYAGSRKEDAQALLRQVRAMGKYPDAKVRKMQVVVKWQLE